jgi:hypothetical protein
MTNEERADRLLVWWGFDLKTWMFIPGKLPPMDEMKSNILDALREAQADAIRAHESAKR